MFWLMIQKVLHFCTGLLTVSFSLWTCWECLPSQPRLDVPGARMLGRAGSRVLRRHGVMPTGPGSLADMHDRALVRFGEVWASMAGVSVVVWFDNMVRPRSFVNPLRNFLLFDCTPISVLHTTQLPRFPGHPKFHQLAASRIKLSTDVRQYFDVFISLVDAVGGQEFSASDLRVPLDVVRSDVRSLRWTPLAVSGSRVTTQLGLVDLLSWAVQTAKHALRPMPLCVDENIHYRLLSLPIHKKHGLLTSSACWTLALHSTAFGTPTNTSSSPSSGSTFPSSST